VVDPTAVRENSSITGAVDGAGPTPAALSFGQWLVSSAAVGEELAARVERDGVLAMVFGTPRKRDARKLEARLLHLIEEAQGDARSDAGPRPIPSVLHHVLDHLLLWLTKIDGSRSKDQMTALVLFESEHDVAFGHVGGGDPVITVDGEPVDVDWVRIEDKKGRDARGFSLYARPGLEFSMEWSLVGGRGTLSKSVFAEWRGSEETGGRPQLRLFEASAPSGDDAEAGATAETDRTESTSDAARPDLKLIVSPSRDAESRIDEPDQVTKPSPADGSRSTTSHEDVAAHLPADVEPMAMASPLSVPESAVLATTSAEQALLDADDAVSPEAVETQSLTGAEPQTEVASITRSTGFFKWLDRIVARRSESSEGSNEATAKAPSQDGSGSATSSAVTSSSDIAGAFGGQAAESEASATTVPRSPVSESAASKTPAEAAPIAPPTITEAARVAPSPVGTAATASRPATTPAPTATASSSASRVATPVPIVSAPATAPPAVAPSRPPLLVVASPEPSTGAAAGKRARRTLQSHATTEDDRAVAPGSRAVPATAPPKPSAPVRTVVVPARRPRRPAWPAASELHHDPPRLWRTVPIAVLVIVLFAGGWMLGRVQSSNPGPVASSSPLVHAMRAIGLAPPRFECRIESQPPGAWIAVDGKSLNRLTPATLELPPGDHTVMLTVPDFGSASFPVKGQAKEHTSLAAELGGTLSVRAGDARRRIEVSVDGVDRGLAPLTLAALSPGAHEVRFSAPGLTPWGQTVRIGVREDAEILARPFQSPATGLLEVKATQTDEDGVRAIEGAAVFVDGRRRGTTPLTLELASGPHSIRVSHRDDQAPVQVIDLPGGNQRFASFQFGLGIEAPRFTLIGETGAMPRDRPSVVSVALGDVSSDEVREMWLHVRSPEGSWRRYPMQQLEGSGAVVGVAVFPLAMLDSKGRAPYYASAATMLGDEYFTELQNVEGPTPPRPRPARSTVTETTEDAESGDPTPTP
jgi:hypothetical protein